MKHFKWRHSLKQTKCRLLTTSPKEEKKKATKWPCMKPFYRFWAGIINRNMINLGMIVYSWCSFYFNDNRQSLSYITEKKKREREIYNCIYNCKLKSRSSGFNFWFTPGLLVYSFATVFGIQIQQCSPCVALRDTFNLREVFSQLRDEFMSMLTSRKRALSSSEPYFRLPET